MAAQKRSRGREHVQAGEIQRPCTKFAIDEYVQRSDRAPVIPMGHVRANLTRLLNGEQLVVVGSWYHPRGILIPCGPRHFLSPQEKESRRKKLEKQMAHALDLLGD